MEAIKPFLSKLIKESNSSDYIFKRNLLKNYLQIVVLDFIYAHSDYYHLVFYGGSALAHCYDLPRLSEDLDFVDIKKKIKISQLAKDLEVYFKKNYDLTVQAKIQKFRIYLKFSLLKELKLARPGESDLLFLKLEIFNDFNFCKKYKIEIIPIFKFNKSILIKTFDLPTMMSTKIRAVLYRQWEKTNKTGRTLIKVKGRDYFDLMWYLNKSIEPNLECLENIKNKDELKLKLLSTIKRVDVRSIRLDLEALIDDRNFLQKLSKEIKKILERDISNL